MDRKYKSVNIQPLFSSGAGRKTMIPIHKLLNRMKWDAAFGRADFVIACDDRVSNSVVKLPLKSLFCELIDHHGAMHSIPLHRILQVYKNDSLIWQRDK